MLKENKLDIKEINFENYSKLQDQLKELSKRKNHDYGSDSLITFGNYGILVRLSDKFDRLKSLYLRQDSMKVSTEKIEDTLMDIINYSMYMILQERGELIK